MSMENSTFEVLDLDDILMHGFAPLHFKVRAMEFLLHLGDHSEIKKSRCISQADKESQAKREEEIKLLLENFLGIKVVPLEQKPI